MIMQEDKEKLIQQLLDSSKIQEILSTLADQEDITAYKLLYSGLKEEPEGGLSLSFKSKVFQQIKVEQARANDIKIYVIAGMVILIGFMFMAFLAFSYYHLLLKYADIIVKIVVFIALALISLTVFNAFEQKYLKLER